MVEEVGGDGGGEGAEEVGRGRRRWGEGGGGGKGRRLGSGRGADRGECREGRVGREAVACTSVYAQLIPVRSPATEHVTSSFAAAGAGRARARRLRRPDDAQGSRLSVGRRREAVGLPAGRDQGADQDRPGVLPRAAAAGEHHPRHRTATHYSSAAAGSATRGAATSPHVATMCLPSGRLLPLGSPPGQHVAPQLPV